MSKKSRSPRPPQQSRVIPAGGVPIIDPNRQAHVEAQQRAVIEQKIQNLVAGIYTENVDLEIKDNEEFISEAQRILNRSFDAAVVFAGEVWGVQIHRNPTRQEQEAARDARMSKPPQPIIDEE